MISLVVDLRDPELERLGVSGGDYRPVKVTVAPSRVVRLATGVGGGFLFDGAPAVKWATTSGPVTFSVPATDGDEILAADRSTFVYRVTVEVDPAGSGKGREPRSVTFSGLLPGSLGASVSVAALAEPPAGPLTLTQYQELDLRVDALEAAPSGGGAVTSVNTKTGAVVLTAADVGAAPASHTHPDPWTYVIATADTSENAATAVNVAGLAIPALADGLYEVEGRVICTSAALATGARVGLSHTTTGADVNLGIIGSNGAAASVVYFPTLASMPGAAGATQSSSSTGKFLGGLVTGTIRATSMTGSVAVTITSEVAGSAVTAKADSFLRYRRISN